MSVAMCGLVYRPAWNVIWSSRQRVGRRQSDLAHSDLLCVVHHLPNSIQARWNEYVITCRPVSVTVAGYCLASIALVLDHMAELFYCRLFMLMVC